MNMNIRITVTLFLFAVCAYGASLSSINDKEIVAVAGELGVSNGMPIAISFVPLNKLRLDHMITKRSAFETGTSPRRKRRRRKKKTSSKDEEGLLKAKKIKAEQLKTESLKARKIQADRIKSDSIISDTVIVTSKKRRRPKKRPSSGGFDGPMLGRRPPSPGDFKLIDFSKGTVNVDVRLPGLSDIFERDDRSRGSFRRRAKPRNSLDRFLERQNPVEMLDRPQSRRRRPVFQDIQAFQPESRSPERKSRTRTINDFQSLVNPTSVPDAQTFSFSKETAGSNMGLLDARDISANSIQARSMNADRITADRIHSQNVKTNTLQIDNNPFAEMSLFIHPSQKRANGHPSGVTKQRGPNYGMTKEVTEVIPNFQLLGISKAKKPEPQMYMEKPVWRQQIKSNVDEYFSPKEPQVKIFLNSSARDRVQSKFSVGAPEYVSDNYNLGQKSLNSFYDSQFV